MNRRYEIKYLIEREKIDSVLKGLTTLWNAQYDTHSKGGSYWVESLYYDDPQCLSFHNHEDGYFSRMKYRLRWYPQDGSIGVNGMVPPYYFEIKQKMGYRSNKLRHKLDFNPVVNLPLITNQLIPYIPSLLGKFLRPRTFIRFKRWALVMKGSKNEIRVTIDAFLQHKVYGKEPLYRQGEYLMSANKAILELKTLFLDDAILNELIEYFSKNRVAVSKYVLSLQEKAHNLTRFPS